MIDNRFCTAAEQQPLRECEPGDFPPERVPSEVAGAAQPRHLKRALVVLMVHLGVRIAAGFAGLLFQGAAAQVDVGVGTRGIALALAVSEGVYFAPVAHVLGVAGRAIPLRRTVVFTPAAAAGGDLD